MLYVLHLAVVPELYETYKTAADRYNAVEWNERDSGFDLFNAASVEVHRTDRLLFGVVSATASALSSDPTFGGYPSAFWLCPRSSISKTALICANSQGLIDKGYRGPIMAAVRNLGSDPQPVKAGERLFQLVSGDAQPWDTVLIHADAATLPNLQSVRGAGGFGSTGSGGWHGTGSGNWYGCGDAGTQ